MDNRITTHRIENPEQSVRVEWGTHSFVAGSHLTLRIGDDRKPLRVNLLKRTELIIGRSTPDFIADIDLSPFDAISLGVSRSHGKLIVADGKLYIEDTGSANGTYVNGTRIAKGERSMLRDGNEVTLGRLKVQFFY